jgi:hypothetical protein
LNKTLDLFLTNKKPPHLLVEMKEKERFYLKDEQYLKVCLNRFYFRHNDGENSASGKVGAEHTGVKQNEKEI